MKVITTIIQDTSKKRTREDIILSSLSGVKHDKDIGYAGFLRKKYLKDFIGYKIVKDRHIKKKICLDEKALTYFVKKALLRCNSIFPIKEVNVLIFPLYNEFVSKNLDGNYGFCPYKKTLILAFDSEKINEEIILATVSHEYAHLVTAEFHSWRSLLDSIIFEGIAENFKDAVTKQPKSDYVKAVTREESIKIINELRPKLNSKSQSLYKRVFFGGKNYKLWTGYSIGYHLIKDFMKKEKQSWKILFKTKPEEILYTTEWI